MFFIAAHVRGLIFYGFIKISFFQLPFEPGYGERDDMKKSLCIEIFFTEAPFQQRFRLAREAGFDYIEFRSWTDKEIPEIKEIGQRYDLGIASASGRTGCMNGTEREDGWRTRQNGRSRPASSIWETP